ncbi:MAG: glutathione peroxidase [Alphaproteobacteria bacterium]|nr:glutathione peroxidase [Alphaproteobacteria bacterium]
MAERRMILAALAAIATLPLIAETSMAASSTPGTAMSAHDFSFDAIEGGPLPLARFKGKAVLIVNTASLCGYTPQYEGLQKLWHARRDKGLVVLGVPSNDFGGQEPEADGKIKEFCAVNFAVDFPMTAKVRVRGPDAHPLYKWIAQRLGPREGEPRWNFHKFLIAPDGSVTAAFGSAIEPLSVELGKAIDAALKRAN